MENTLKVMVTGSRTFDDESVVTGSVEEMVYLARESERDILFIEGGARGLDRMVKNYCVSKGYPVKTVVAEWDKLGKSAGYIRNSAMAEECDVGIAFWDMNSKGTKHAMIELIKKDKLAGVYISLGSFKQRRFNINLVNKALNV